MADLRKKASMQQVMDDIKPYITKLNYSQVSRHKKAKIFRNRSIILPPV